MKLEAIIVPKFKTMEEMKLSYLLQILKHHKYSISKSASTLNIERKTIYLILKKNGYTLHKKNLYHISEAA